MNKPLFQASHLTWSKIAMVTCLIACLGDITSVNIFSRYYPGFNAITQPISALGARGSPVAHLVSAWWIFVGFLFLIFAISYKRSEKIQTKAHILSAWLFGIYAVGEEMGSGIFPGNRILGQLTAIGIVHNVIGGIGTGALIVSPFILLKKYQQKDDWLMSRYLLFVCISGILSFAVFSLSHFTIQGTPWLYKRHGFFQRIFISDYYLFMMVIAIKIYYEKWTTRIDSRFIPLQQP